MTASFGAVDPKLTKAVNRIGRGESGHISFTRHAEDEMEADAFDHQDVLECLSKGKAHAAEHRSKGLCSNVVHRGRHIRVVVGGLDDVGEDWSQLSSVRVVTVMRLKP